MDLFLRIYKHLLPKGRAWSLVIDGMLRKFFEGISGLPDDVRNFIDDIWSDLWPQTSRDIEAWERQFGIIPNTAVEADRRAALAAAWLGGGVQSPHGVQAVLRAAGFDVYVHDPWYFSPGKTIRDARALLTPPGVGYPLANKFIVQVPSYVDGVMCGDPAAICGEPDALAGNSVGAGHGTVPTVVPTDPNTWPYFWYVGAQTFGALATIDAARRNEFETLLLKLKPAHTWVGVFATYS